MNDKERIEKLGGVLELSKILGVSYQRVFNWKKRNAIPLKMKINHPEMFMPKNENEVKPLAGKQWNNPRKYPKKPLLEIFY